MVEATVRTELQISNETINKFKIKTKIPNKK